MPVLSCRWVERSLLLLSLDVLDLLENKSKTRQISIKICPKDKFSVKKQCVLLPDDVEVAVFDGAFFSVQTSYNSELGKSWFIFLSNIQVFKIRSMKNQQASASQFFRWRTPKRSENYSTYSFWMVGNHRRHQRRTTQMTPMVFSQHRFDLQWSKRNYRVLPHEIRWTDPSHQDEIHSTCKP